MSELTLVIGSRNTSSWSLRAWLGMVASGLPFEEVVVPLHRPDTAELIRRWSPSGRIPVLLVDGEPIWDSLAICERLAESTPSLWPADLRERAQARSVACEMHAGFADLRRFMPMDVTARFTPPGRLLRGVARDVQRIVEVWNDCRERYADRGPFLFGSFSIADVMYAPVASRFVTYAVPLDPVSVEYVETMLSVPAMRAWAEAAALEVEAEAAPRPTAPGARTASGPLPANPQDSPPLPSMPPAQPLPERSPSLPRRREPATASPSFAAAEPAAETFAPSGAMAQAPGSATSARPPAQLRQAAPIKPIGDGIRRRR